MSYWLGFPLPERRRVYLSLPEDVCQDDLELFELHLDLMRVALPAATKEAP